MNWILAYEAPDGSKVWFEREFIAACDDSSNRRSFEDMASEALNDARTGITVGGDCIRVELAQPYARTGNEIGIPLLRESKPPASGVTREQPHVRLAPAPLEPPAVAASAPDAVWPRWVQHVGSGTIALLLSAVECDGVYYGEDSCVEPASEGWWDDCVTRITPAEAAKWLRANGHLAVADEIERK